MQRIELHGEYDISRRGEVQRLFDGIPSGPLIVDLSRVTYVDSLFLQDLIRLKGRLADVSLASPSPSVWRLLKLCGLTNHFRIVES